MSTCAPASFVPHAEALARAERGLRELAAARRDRWYPAFHIASDGGWINDPNGLSYFGGRWHVFYQLHPFGPQWGPMHWGHVSSADLVTWRREPVALAPSLEVERAGVYSESAVVGDDGRLRLFYTAHRWRNGRDEADGNQEVQCAACSTDGTRFEKLGVVVDNPDDLRDFRDPKVLRRDGRWYMVVGRRSPDRRGEIVLYASDDLDRWSWAGVLYRHPDPRVYMIECPDLFCLRAPGGDERWVLFLSAMRSQAPADGADGASKGEKNDEGAAAHDHVDTSGYLVGTWQPGEPFRPEGPARPLDRGGSLYAPQTMEAPDGRRLMVGWMRPDGALDVQDDNWCGQLSVPRELALGDNGTLRSVLARELAALRGPARELGPLALGAEEALTLTDDARTAEVALSAPLGAATLRPSRWRRTWPRTAPARASS